MKITKHMRNKGRKGESKVNRNRRKVTMSGNDKNRSGGDRAYWLTQKDMASMKYDESIANSQAKREGKKLVGVSQCSCGCGAEGCCYTTSLEDSGASLPKKQKKGTPTKAGAVEQI